MNWFKIVLIITILFSLYSCGADNEDANTDVKKYLNQLDKFYPELKTVNIWDITTLVRDKEEGYIYCSMEGVNDNNVKYGVGFYIDIKTDAVKIDLMDKEFFVGDTMMHFSYESLDTQYVYFVPSQNKEQKIFIRGEYAYKYAFGGMKWSEKEYYINHLDSLRAIKGNNLPPLPR